MQLRKFASMYVCKYAIMHEDKYASMEVCDVLARYCQVILMWPSFQFWSKLLPNDTCFQMLPVLNLLAVANYLILAF